MAFVFDALADRVKSHQTHEQLLLRDLINEGPRLINQLSALSSLRSVAADAGLSPTYLSQVKNGKIILSQGAYLKLARLQGWKP